MQCTSAVEPHGGFDSFGPPATESVPLTLLTRAVILVAGMNPAEAERPQCSRGSRPTGHLRTVALTNDRKSIIEETRDTANLGNP